MKCPKCNDERSYDRDVEVDCGPSGEARTVAMLTHCECTVCAFCEERIHDDEDATLDPTELKYVRVHQTCWIDFAQSEGICRACGGDVGLAPRGAAGSPGRRSSICCDCARGA